MNSMLALVGLLDKHRLEIEAKDKRIAELEKENKGYQIALSLPSNNEAHNLEQVDKFISFCKNASSLTGLDKLQIHSLGILYSQQAKLKERG